VRLRLVASMAARIPAPPAPTMTVSYLWICMGRFPCPALA
jgi:hypothetical protein